jgi:hypothetical protein
MPDWTKSMEQSFEYYTVHPQSLADVKRIDVVTSASFNRDLELETLGSATVDVMTSVGESYIRGYLKTIQNGVIEKHPLGTVLVQTPSSSFDGKVRSVSMDAYTPLIELKENQPPLGYTLTKDTKIMDAAYDIVSEHVRVPVIRTDCSKTLTYNFVANTNDTWLTFVKDLIANADYELELDAMGQIMFSPKQEIYKLQPIWTFDDSNSSILYPDITVNHDLYKIPNVVKVVYSYGGEYLEAVVENNDPNSPTSIINRGRRITHYEPNPSLAGATEQSQVEAYATRLLEQLSTVEYSVSYTHGYCPVRVGDCVRLDYKAAGLNGVNAKVISQNIKCEPGCPVTEKAVFVNKFWG